MSRKMDKMLRLLTVFPVVLLMIVFLAGCAGLRPAVKPPPPVADVQKEETETPQADEAETTEPETDETPSIEEVETEEEEVQLNDDLDLPSGAMPSGILPVAPVPVPMIPNDGPAPKGAEPVTLTDGWKVKIIQAPSMDTIQQVQAQLGKVTGEKTHVHWQNGSFVLVLGNFAERDKAEALKEKMVLHGYEQSAVIKSPIVADEPAPVMEVVETDTIQEEEILYGWRIQVMSLNDMASARAELSGIQNRTGLKAYIEEVSGSFKIRVGNFKDKAKALEAKEQVVEAGFEGVFPVETRIENE